MNDLLTQAERLLGGGVAVPAYSARAACWLARAALEVAVRELLRARGLEPGTATMRSCLSCLESQYRSSDQAMVLRATYSWSELSGAIHHHAFALAPTLSEARHLVDLVTRLSADAEPAR